MYERLTEVRAVRGVVFGLATVFLVAFVAWWAGTEARACRVPDCARKRLVPVNRASRLSRREAIRLATLGLSPPSGVTQMSGFPRASSTWCCGAALYYDIDDADARQEGLMPCTAECLQYTSPQIQRCYDSIWVMKSGGINARHFPVTMKGHPCSCMAVADLDGDSKPEIVIGNDINLPSSSKIPDSRIYVFNHDGSVPSGFPKDVARGPIPGGICLVDLDSWKAGGDSAPEILFGTRGWMASGVPYAGKITALNADGSYLASWNKSPDDYKVVNAPAVGDLLGGVNFPGNEVVFVVCRFYQSSGAYRYESQVMACKRDGTLLATYDLGDIATSSTGSMSSPAIGKILSYENNDITSNIVVCSGPNTTADPATDGKIWVLHLVPNGTGATIACDWSTAATIQQCEDENGNDVPDGFRADPAIADLDNDNQNEIVAFSAQGTLFVVDYVATAFTVTTATVATCALPIFRCSSPLVFDLDSDHSDMEIVVCTSLDPHDAAEPSVMVYKYSQANGLSKLYDIGPFPDNIEMTPALGDIDGDDKTDMLVQPLRGGLIYCLEFDNSDYDAAINAKGWPCMGRNAARTHCAD